MTTATKTDNRERLIEGIIEATRPEKTGTFSFDYFGWEEQKPVLHLGGDHGTPNFTLTFFANNTVLVSPDSNPSWAKAVETAYTDISRLVQDLLATMAVIEIVGAL